MTVTGPPWINFPTFTTPLIGRDADVMTITTRLRRSPHRFATLVGTSGTGKTRLSMQIAAAMEADFPAGMVFVALASITDPGLVIPTIARTLGVPESASTGFFDSLAASINTQTMLLILDNFEQVVEAAPAVAELLDHAPFAQVLCTSQIPTQLPNEEVIAIPPLALPDNHTTNVALEESPAVALFVERMRQVQPHFSLTSHNARAVVELCRRLYGLPLAIELVATHSERLQPEDLLLLLRSYLPQERHRRDMLTPEEVIFPVLSWCVAYGPPSIRWLLPRLGVLWGEWHESEAVALASNAPADVSVKDALHSMVNKGLLLSIRKDDGEPTFTMLDAIRQFASRRLRGDELLLKEMSNRHADVFGALLHQLEADFQAGKGAIAGSVFNSAMPNLRAAVQWHLDHEQYAEAIAMAANLAFPSYQQGYIREALNWIDRTTPFIDHAPPDGQVRWYYAEELLASQVADYPRAIRAADLGMELARQTNNQHYLTWILGNKALVMLNQGHLADARGVFEMIVDSPTLDAISRAVTLNNLGCIAKELNDLDAALRYHQQSLTIREESEDGFGIAMSLHNIADVQYALGEYEIAEKLFRECLEVVKLRPNSLIYAETLTVLSDVLLNRDLQQPSGEAQTLLRTAIEICWQNEYQRELLLCFESYADWLVRAKRHRLAAELLGGIVATRRRLNIVDTERQAVHGAALRNQIDLAIGKALRLESETVGSQHSLEQMIQLIASD